MLVEIDKNSKTNYSLFINPDHVAYAAIESGSRGFIIKFSLINGEVRASQLFKDFESAAQHLSNMFGGKVIRLK